MCDCKFKIGKKGSLPSGIIGIPLETIDSFPSSLLLGWCMNEDKVKAAFKSKTGLNVDQNDLGILIKAHKNGSDFKQYKVSFLDVINAITFTQLERDNSSCKYMVTV